MPERCAQLAPSGQILTMSKVLPILFLIALLACSREKTHQSNISYRDTIMKKYFAAIDAMTFSDTSDRDLKFVKAYYESDTAYLNQVLTNAVEMLQYKEEILINQRCENPFDLKASNYEEAYRFYYRASFCDTSVNITLGRKNDTLILEAYLFNVDNRQQACKIIKQVKKALSEEHSNKLINGLIYLDFWGMSENNGSFGFDGSSLYVTGYERQKNAFKGNYKKIYRWSSEHTALGHLFKQLIDLSDIKVKCFHF